MSKTTLFQLRAHDGQVFDGSTLGLAIRAEHNVAVLQTGNGLRLDKGALELPWNQRLAQLHSFTIEATVTPRQIAGDRRNIVEAQEPPVALFIQPDGKLVGSVRTKDGWVSVDSGKVTLAQGQKAQVRFLRHADGDLELQINDRTVGKAKSSGTLVPAGKTGFTIGAWIDGTRYPFVGEIEDLAIHEGVASKGASDLTARAQAIVAEFQKKTQLKRVRVSLIPDEGRARLQPIRDILNAAGVEKLSDLENFRIDQPTVLTPGTVLVAAKKQAQPKPDWSKIADIIRKASPVEKRMTLATTLTNRNSLKLLDSAATGKSPTTQTPKIDVLTQKPLTAGTITSSGRIQGLSTPLNTGTRLPAEVRMASPTLRRQLDPVALPELVAKEGTLPKVADEALLHVLDTANPALWPSPQTQQVRMYSLTTIPVHSAVIIANQLDLTNIELRIEPTVSKVYIIAEELICGPNARITWRRPGGTTPPRADDPSLNGRGWAGVHTKRDSRDGLDGEPGRPGTRGIDGARGHDAPDLEIWVKRLSAVPDIDLVGEEGRPGGRGQRGGRGGNGADGQQGWRRWFFGWYCSERAGHGGHGGDGGNGGPGGRGGDGGGGGNITIGVLEGTLAETVTERAFKIKNQGGARGQGGEGGPGGAGGKGGRAGIGETCRDAQHGRNGAQGQPGPRGAQGTNVGIDGQMEFFEFDEDAWNEMLTRPWISELTPSEVFPGDTLIIRGSRFVSGDRVLLGSTTLVPTIHPDERISVTVPTSIAGGRHAVVLRRPDGTESNRLEVGVKPRLDAVPPFLTPNTAVDLTGRAFQSGASVLLNGEAVPATVKGPNLISFTVPDTDGSGLLGGDVTVQVRNPDGRVSNPRTASKPHILEVPFRYGVHNLSFPNFSDGVPDWGTFEETFGAAEVWHELLDPVFGHPALTVAYFAFYEYFLKGTANGGLATGFCTSLTALVADKFWRGDTDAPAVTKTSVHRLLTAIHGKLLSRESLLHFHDQGRWGVQRVEATAREIEATFLRGCDRHNAPLLFFIPSGTVWDEGYFDKLGSSHCVMPYRFVYAPSHPGPRLANDGTTTYTPLDGVEMYVWDCNHPTDPNCRIVFREIDGVLHFEYFVGGRAAPVFTSMDGVTLGMMTNGQYLLADHDLPFSGPLGLTNFIVDFLLSPADLQVTDGLGLRTGNFGGQILAEIPGSVPAYLVPGMYLYPANTPLVRRIVGNGNGTYTFNTLMPGGASVVIENVETAPGQEDVLAMNGDGTQIRYVPGKAKAFNLTLSRLVGAQARAVAIEGVAAGPDEEVDITLSPDLSLVRVGNRGAERRLDVKAFSIDRTANRPVNKVVSGTKVPKHHDLLIAVPDWNKLDMSVEALSFE